MSKKRRSSWTLYYKGRKGVYVLLIMKKSSVYSNTLSLLRAESSFEATLCYCYLSETIDYEKIILSLHPYEQEYFNSLKFQKRANSYLIGRFAAKQAVALLSGEKNLANILIPSGIFQQPLVASGERGIQVSITHCDDFGAAIAFPEGHPMGIDMESIAAAQRSAMETVMTDREKEQLGSFAIGYEAGLTLLWTAKEALSKVLRTGMMTPFEIFEIVNMEQWDHYVICYYKNFAQYKAACFSLGSHFMCSIAYPLKTELVFDFGTIKRHFA